MRAFSIFNRRIVTVWFAAAAALALSAPAAAGVTPEVSAGTAESIGALLQAGRYQEALETIDALPRESRAQPQIRLYQGMSLMALDRRPEALRAFEALAAERPDMPEPFNNMAVIQAADGRYGEARLLLESALRADAGYSVALENIGDVYIKLANQSYARLLTLDPKRKSAKKRHEAVQMIGRVIDRPGSAR